MKCHYCLSKTIILTVTLNCRALHSSSKFYPYPSSDFSLSLYVCLCVQDYLLAVEVYESLLEELPGLRDQLLSVMGRLHLTLGDLPSAQCLFSLASSSSSEEREEEEEAERERMVRNHINQ